MELQRLATVTEQSGLPLEAIEELNDELEDSPFAIHCVPSGYGYKYLLTMEGDV